MEQVPEQQYPPETQTDLMSFEVTENGKELSCPKAEVKQISENVYHVKYPSGSAYVGGYVDGKREGAGVHTGSTNCSYNGEWHNDKFHGYGEYKWADGSFHKGYWENGLAHGFGHAYNATSKTDYQGQWKEDNKHGQGTMIYEDKSRYVGEWLYDKPHGTGIKYDSDTTYTGDWAKGKKHGRGKITWKDEKEYYEGDWVKGKMTGRGIYKYANGNFYQGRIKNDEEEGEGVMQYAATGNVFCGTFKGGFSINGTLYYANGDIYVGDCVDEVRVGTGKMEYAHENVVYEGGWRRNKRHGQGSLTVYSEELDYNWNPIPPRVVYGEWRNDMFYEPVRMVMNAINRAIFDEDGRPIIDDDDFRRTASLVE